MMALTPEEIKKRLEQISKLPPKDRVIALQRFEEEQKKAREDEEKKLQQQKKESEALLKRSIEEVALEEEEEEKKLRESSNKKETLEEIAKEAPSNISEQEQRIAQQYQLAQRPAQELYQEAKSLQNNFAEKGYLNSQEQYLAKDLSYAMDKKESSNYSPDERAKGIMNATEQMLEEMKNKNKPRYLN